MYYKFQFISVNSNNKEEIHFLTTNFIMPFLILFIITSGTLYKSCLSSLSSLFTLLYHNTPTLSILEYCPEYCAIQIVEHQILPPPLPYWLGNIAHRIQ